MCPYEEIAGLTTASNVIGSMNTGNGLSSQFQYHDCVDHWDLVLFVVFHDFKM